MAVVKDLIVLGNTNVTGKISEENILLENKYKKIQTAVNDPTASGNATAFIDTISQDDQGKITVTKKNVDLSSGDIHVKQTDKSTETTSTWYPILASAQSNPTSGNAYESIYDSNFKINPSLHSLSEGDNTTASGSRSHAGGLGTIANQDNMTAIGTYNTSGETGDLFVIGNGSDNVHRSNVLSVNGSTKKITLDSDGGIKLPSGGSNTKVWNTNGGITELSGGTNISLSDDDSGEVTINANIPKTQHELIYFDPERTNNGYDGLITAQLMYEDGIIVDNPADFNKCIDDTSWEEIDFTMQDVAENYITELISCNPYIDGRGGTGDGNILQDSGFTKGAINDSSNPFWGYDSNKDYITAKFNDNWGSRIAFIYNEDAPDKYFIHDALYGYSANHEHNDCIGLAFFSFNKTVFNDGSTQSYGNESVNETSYLKTTRLQIDLGVRPNSKNVIMSLGMAQNKRKPGEDITYLADAYWRNGAPDRKDTKLGQPYNAFIPDSSSNFSIIGNSSSSQIQESTMLNPGSYDGADGSSTIGFVRCVTERSENIYRFKFSQPDEFTWNENYKHTIGQQVVASEIIIDMDEYKIHYKPIGATSFTTIDVTDSTQKALFDEFKNNDVYYGFWQSSTPQGAIYNISYTRGSKSSLSNLILNTDNDTVWQYTYDGWQQLTQYIPSDLFSGSHLNYNHITKKLWYSNGSRIYEIKSDGGGGGTSGIDITVPTTNATYPILLGNTDDSESDVTSIQKSVGLVVNPSKKSVAEGDNTTASGYSSHAEGSYTIASGSDSHAEGWHTTASGDYSHVEGAGGISQLSNITSRTSTTITFSTLPSSIKIGRIIKDANGTYAKVTNITSNVVTVGSNLSTSGNLYVQLGIAYGAVSHAEGTNTTASGNYSHTEGSITAASGNYSHAEGAGTTASGSHSHAEGSNTIASGNYSHAEGHNTTASEAYSHAGGYFTVADQSYMTAIGKFNENGVANERFAIGNGESVSARRTVFNIVGNDSGSSTSTCTVNVQGIINASQGLYQTSDINKKNIIGDLDLDKAYKLIDKCQTILYTLKDSENNKQQVGLIAQEVKEFFPELISEDKNGMLSLDYAKLTVVILKVLKDLIERVSRLERK